MLDLGKLLVIFGLLLFASVANSTDQPFASDSAAEAAADLVADDTADVQLGATWPASCLGNGESDDTRLGWAGAKCWIFHQHWYVFPWNPIRHSWIRYAGKVFEFIGDSKSSSVLVHDRPFAADRCANGIVRSLGQGPQPASPDGLVCAQGCARGYQLAAGNYSLLCNNCHNFANSLAAVLLSADGCPQWCRTPGL